MQTTYTKPWYKSKTIWYAIVSGVAGIVTAIGAQYPTLAGLAIANSVITMALRFVTDTSVSSAS